LNEVLRRATGAVGGTLINQPFYAGGWFTFLSLFFFRIELSPAFHQQTEITVHPLGGAVMSADGTGRNGVTNAEGQVFTGDGEDVYEGLICADGAVVPTALGTLFHSTPFSSLKYTIMQASTHLQLSLP
jgi:hypothetical protein